MADQGKNDNKPLSVAHWAYLKQRVTAQLGGKRLFVVDGFCGASAGARLRVRFVVEVAWQAYFVKNMFIRPPASENFNHLQPYQKKCN